MKQQELAEVIRTNHAQLEAALQGLTAEQLQAPGALDEWSVKDVLAHITAWEVDLLTVLGKVRRGQKPGKVNWRPEEIDAQNAKWHAEYRDRPLARVLDDFRGAHKQVARLVDSLSDTDLAAPVPWRRGRPLYEMFLVYGAEHEAKHLPALQAWRQQHVRAANGAH